jgi:hypothetical protein
MIDTTFPWQEYGATEMDRVPDLVGDLRNLSATDSQSMSQWIDRCRALPSEVTLNESFFPFGVSRQPRTDGYARLALIGEGLIVLFRNQSNDPTAVSPYPASITEPTKSRTGEAPFSMPLRARSSATDGTCGSLAGLPHAFSKFADHNRKGRFS